MSKTTQPQGMDAERLAFAIRIRDGIADFIADNWTLRKFTLAEIELGVRAIEINVHLGALAAADWQEPSGGRDAAQPTALPAGWVAVPAEPTEAMHVAAVKTIIRCAGNDDFPPRVYRAMLAAAPAIPKP